MDFSAFSRAAKKLVFLNITSGTSALQLLEKTATFKLKI